MAFASGAREEAPGNSSFSDSLSIIPLTNKVSSQTKLRACATWGVVTEIKEYAMQVCTCNEISHTYRLVRTPDCHGMPL